MSQTVTKTTLKRRPATTRIFRKPPEDTTPLIVNDQQIDPNTISPIKSPGEKNKSIPEVKDKTDEKNKSIPEVKDKTDEYEKKIQQDAIQRIIHPTFPPETIDVNNITSEEEETLRMEYKGLYGRLRRRHPQYKIKEPPDNASIKIIVEQYYKYIRVIRVDNVVDKKYRLVLIVFLMAVELLGAYILNLPFLGFTEDQLDSWEEYDLLLIELGEENFNAQKQKGSVYTRLLFSALINAAIFIVLKLIANYLGIGLNKIIKKKAKEIIAGAMNPEKEEDGKDKDGFDFGRIISGLGGLLGQFKGNDKPASRVPPYPE